MRRPRPIRTQGVGIWINAIHSIAIVSIFTNAFAIAMSAAAWESRERGVAEGSITREGQVSRGR